MRVLKILAEESREMGVTQVADKLQLDKSTVYRLLSTLCRHQFVCQNPDNSKYRLGWGVFEVGSVVPAMVGIGDAAGRAVREMCEATGETVNLAVRDDRWAVVILKEAPQQVLRTELRIGRREPLHATALGKVLLSDLTDEDVCELLPDGLEAYTPNTITSADRLSEELAGVRESGYAFDDEEFSLGMRCIACPVRDHTGRAVAALSLSGPTHRLVPERMTELRNIITLAAGQLSGELGFRRLP